MPNPAGGATPDATWPVLCDEHRRALDRFLEAAQGLDQRAWRRRPAPDKWCPGQVAEHLSLSYDALLREMDGGGGIRVRGRWWLRLYLRLLVLPRVLREGRLPPGAPAVRELRPADEPRPSTQVVADLRGKAVQFEDGLTRARIAGGGRLTHPFFGRLSAAQALRFVTMHIDHHRRQLTTTN